NPSNLDSVKDYQLLEITPQDQLSSLSSTSLKHQSFFITFQIIESNHHTSIHTIITTIDKEFIIWDLENPARSLKFLAKDIGDSHKYQSHQINSNLKLVKEYTIDSQVKKSVKSRTKLSQLQYQQDLKRHPDVITGLQVVSNPYEMIISCDRSGAVIVGLVDLVVTNEQRLSTVQLGKDTANGPHVNGFGVASSAQQKLWGSVPPGGHVVGDGMWSLFQVHWSDTSGQSEITDLEVPLVVDQDVAWLQVSVNDIC
ncbi:hypothetical protein WICPIJ_003209, partial [Wickerhamomyces pijperi]